MRTFATFSAGKQKLIKGVQIACHPVDKKEKIELRSRAKKIEPVLRIGKSGLSESVLKEIGKLLEKRNLVKIKLLKTSLSASGKNDFINKLALITGSELIDSIGNIIVIYRK